MAYRDLGEFLDPDLVLPIRGRRYRITSPNAHEGLRLRQLFTTPDAQFSDQEELTEVMRLFGAGLDEHGQWSGGVWGQMVDDGLTWPEIFHAGRTALMHYALSPELAELNWHRGAGDDSGNPVPPAPSAPGEPDPASPTPSGRGGKKKNQTSRSRVRTARTTPAEGSSSPSSG